MPAVAGARGKARRTGLRRYMQAPKPAIFQCRRRPRCQSTGSGRSLCPLSYTVKHMSGPNMRKIAIDSDCSSHSSTGNTSLDSANCIKRLDNKTAGRWGGATRVQRRENVRETWTTSSVSPSWDTQRRWSAWKGQHQAPSRWKGRWRPWLSKTNALSRSIPQSRCTS